MKRYKLRKNIIFSSSEIEKVFLISLKDWSLTIVEGVNSLEYLQSQLTIDMFKLAHNNYFFCAHCNSNGKVLSNLIIFRYNTGYAYIQRESVSSLQIFELKKYAVFSNINICKSEQHCLLGIVGKESRNVLKLFFKIIPDKTNPIVKEKNNFYILWFEFPCERFLVVIPLDGKEDFILKLSQFVYFSNDDQWHSLNIEMGFPSIDVNNFSKFIPQEINLLQLNAINFKKGCYRGQEIIAKTKFKKISRSLMYWVVGKSGKVPFSGEKIEVKYGHNWVVRGSVLIAVRLCTETIWIQAILRGNLTSKSVLRIKNYPENIFYIKKIFN